MIYAALMVHLILVWINYYISKSFLYPPTVFVTLWSVALLFLILVGDFFYPLSGAALLIFVGGSIAFTLGGVLSNFYRCKVSSSINRRSKRMKKFLDYSLVFMVIIFPFYIIRLRELSALSGIGDFWVGLRVQTSTGLKDEIGFGIFAYIGAYANFVTLAAFSEMMKSYYSKQKTMFLIIFVFAYNIISAARSGVMVLLLSMVCVYILHRGFKLKSAFIAVVVFVLLFSIPAVMLEKGTSKESSFSENVTSFRESLQIYALSGLVAFDQAISHPGQVSSNNRSFMFFLNVLKAVGFDVKIESSNLDYITTPSLTNVYSIYFPYYFDFGFGGVVLIMVALGFILSIFYRFAILGANEFIFMYSLSFSFLLLSLFTEAFLTSLSYWIQAIVFAFIFFKASSLSLQRKYRVSGF